MKKQGRQESKNNAGATGNRKRRRLLQALSVGGVAAGAAALPEKWISPVIDSVNLPAHGQTTGPLGFCGEGALSFTDAGRVLEPGTGLLAMRVVNDGTGEPAGMLDALVPPAHAGEPPGGEETLLASSSSFGFTLACLSVSDELTVRFDLILNEGDDNPFGINCTQDLVVPLCYRGSVDDNGYSPLSLINCPGSPFEALQIEAIIVSRNADEVLMGFRVEGSSEDALMLFPGGSEPACPQCPQDPPDGFECTDSDP